MGAQCLSFFLLLSLAYLQSSLGRVPRLPNVMEVSFGTGIHQNRLPELNVDEVVKCFENVITNEGTVLITTDYDGTVAPFVMDPKDAIPRGALLESLRELSKSKYVFPWVVSARDKEFLGKHFDQISTLGVVGNHGVNIHWPTLGAWEDKALPRVDQADIDHLYGIMQESVERIKLSTKEYHEDGLRMGWHYRKASEANASGASKESKELTERLQKAIKDKNLPLSVVQGSMVVEVKPTKFTKEAVMSTIFDSLDKKPDLVLVFGDSAADEEMFKFAHSRELSTPGGGKLPKVFTSQVQNTQRIPTVAKSSLPSPLHTILLLEKLADVVRQERLRQNSLTLSGPLFSPGFYKALKPILMRSTSEKYSGVVRADRFHEESPTISLPLVLPGISNTLGPKFTRSISNIDVK